jgi:hypothetical protein
MQKFFCWIITITPSYQDGLIAGLAKKGYMVGPLSNDGHIISPGKDASTVIALNVYHQNNPAVTVEKMYNDVATILIVMKARYHSIIIAKSVDSIWYGANYDLSDIPIEEDLKKILN